MRQNTETFQKLTCIIKNKRHSMLSSGVVWLQDNICPGTANRTHDPISSFG